jgi:hypothetical protein
MKQLLPLSLFSVGAALEKERSNILLMMVDDPGFAAFAFRRYWGQHLATTPPNKM